MRSRVVSGIRPSFPGLSQSQGQVTHVLLTRSPLEYPRRGLSVRLACVKHAASVRPEPGSNSPLMSINRGSGEPETRLTMEKSTPRGSARSLVHVELVMLVMYQRNPTSATDRGQPRMTGLN